MDHPLRALRVALCTKTKKKHFIYLSLISSSSMMLHGWKCRNMRRCITLTVPRVCRVKHRRLFYTMLFEEVVETWSQFTFWRHQHKTCLFLHAYRGIWVSAFFLSFESKRAECGYYIWVFLNHNLITILIFAFTLIWCVSTENFVRII